VTVWNNTFVGNARNINLVQDSRNYLDSTQPGKDSRQPYPDPTMTWQLGPVSVGDNVMALATSAGNCLLCVEDYTKTRTAEQIGVTADGDVYNRLTTSSPTWVVVWSAGSGNNLNPYVYTSVSAFRTAKGQEAHGVGYDGTAVVDSTGHPTATVTNAEPTVAQPLPSAVATATGKSSGVRHLGVWF
jgi:hypothetical protein